MERYIYRPMMMLTPFFPALRARLAAHARQQSQTLRQIHFPLLVEQLRALLPAPLLSSEDEGTNSRERVFSVRLRVPTGTEQLDRMGLSAEEVAQVLQRAVNRAYPFLEREGIRDNFLYSPRGKALDVEILVPEYV